MAFIGSVDIGVGADTTPLKGDLGKAAATVQSFGARIDALGSVVKGAFAAAIGGAAVGGLLKLAGAAAHATEAANKIDAVFGEQSSEVQKSARAMAEAYGIATTEILDKEGQLGSLFSGAGFNADATAKFSQVFASLANDLSRFNDTSFETAFEKLRAGLSGESEPLKAFGILLNEDSVKARAYEMGLARTGEALSETAKIQARANIILEKSGPAIGAAAREADGASAKMEAFRGRVENLTVAIGETFVDVVGDALGGVGTAIAVMGDAWKDAAEKVFGWVGPTVEACGIAGESINLVEVALGGVANGVQVLGFGFEALQGVVQQVFTWIAQGAVKLIGVLDSLGERYLGFSTGLSEQFRDFAESMSNSTKAAGEDFFRRWDETPWASDAVSKRFQDARDKLAALRQDLAKTPLTLPADVGGEGSASSKDKKKSPANPFGGAALFGSQEGASIALRTRYGARQDAAADATKQTAKNTGQLVAQNRELVRAIGGIGAVGIMEV